MAASTRAISAEGGVRSMAKCKNCTNLYNLSDENDVVVGKWCPRINDSPDIDMKRECEHFKRMTQADCIHSMSDEELAELFVYWDCAGADYTTNLPINGCKWGSKEEMLSRVLEYLQSEVEE